MSGGIPWTCVNKMFLDVFTVTSLCAQCHTDARYWQMTMGARMAGHYKERWRDQEFVCYVTGWKVWQESDEVEGRSKVVEYEVVGFRHLSV